MVGTIAKVRSGPRNPRFGLQELTVQISQIRCKARPSLPKSCDETKLRPDVRPGDGTMENSRHVVAKFDAPAWPIIGNGRNGLEAIRRNPPKAGTVSQPGFRSQLSSRRLLGTKISRKDTFCQT